MSLSGLPTVPGTPGGLSGLPRRQRPRPFRGPTWGAQTAVPVKDHFDPEELADDDISQLDEAGDDRAAFNLGRGSRWIQPTPIDGDEEE